MLILAIISIAGLTYLAYAATRTALFPPVLFSGTWLLSLVGLGLFGRLFYPISGESYLVYIVGAASFTVGGFLGLVATARSEQRYDNHNHARNTARLTLIALDIALIVVIGGIPLYWHQVARTAGDLPLPLLLQHVRFVAVEATGEPRSFSLVGNLVVLAQIVAVVMFYEDDKCAARRARAILAIVAAIIYGALSGAKGTAVVLVLTLFFVSWIRSGEVKIKTVLITLGGSLSLFAIGLLLVNYAFVSFSDFSAVPSALAKTLANYWLGGLVAFDYAMPKLHTMESTQTAARFFLESAAGLGAHVSVPNVHAEYTAISQDMDTNTYTIYFSYFKDFGWFGMSVLLVLLGAALTALFRDAARRRPVALILYSMLCAGLALSFHAEHLLLGLNGYIKAWLFLFLLYHLIPGLGRRSQHRALLGA